MRSSPFLITFEKGVTRGWALSLLDYNLVMQGFTLEFRQLLIMQTYVCKISSEAFDLQIQFFQFIALFESFQR